MHCCSDGLPGSFVPADAAVIGLTDKILTRVTTRETVSRVSRRQLQPVLIATD